MNNSRDKKGQRETAKVFDAVINEKDPQERIKSGWIELPNAEASKKEH